jgi:hypothetical protein
MYHYMKTKVSVTKLKLIIYRFMYSYMKTKVSVTKLKLIIYRFMYSYMKTKVNGYIFFFKMAEHARC